MPHMMNVPGPIAPEEDGFTTIHEHIPPDARVMRRCAVGMLGENPAWLLACSPQNQLTGRRLHKRLC